ncbi:hypothetical protein MGAD_48320 [Mycolicibacterium gadium]|uniref:Uncharacterized protein n=1 Tax=Mycolicibacterium gadium TaxID=1794 RepID=A0A7I7WUT5_MYCGU|nr:hypothetical protein MGAD_48320 [Mycolicibacterium gadium]
MHGMGGLVEFGQCGAGDDRDGMAAMGTHLAGGDAQLQSEFDAVVTPLCGAAVIAILDRGAVGQMPARTHRGSGGFDIAAGFGVDPPRQP